LRNNQARFVFRILAVPVALLIWFVALVFGFQGLASGDFKQVAASFIGCLLAVMFTWAAFRGQAPRWLYLIFTWGGRP
jgi:arginine exporter protein ArgO